MSRISKLLVVTLFLAATAYPTQAHASGWSSLWYRMVDWAQRGCNSLADGCYQLTVVY